jgi:ribosomal protein S8
MHFKPAPAKLCSQLLTTSRAALARTAVPYSPANLAITSILLRQGLISNLSLGSPEAPSPQSFHQLPLPAQRLWVGLKHRQGQPVLRRISLVSKGSKRVVVSRDELGRLLTGRRAQNVDGVGMGEILIVRDISPDNRGWLEGWEAWRLGVGGELVCRAG